MNEEHLLKCIVDNNRRKILHILGNGEKCVNDIVECTGLVQTLVSFHLKALRDCGLVLTRRDGRNIIYRVSDPTIIEVLDKIHDASKRLTEISECEACSI